MVPFSVSSTWQIPSFDSQWIKPVKEVQCVEFIWTWFLSLKWHAFFLVCSHVTTFLLVTTICGLTEYILGRPHLPSLFLFHDTFLECGTNWIEYQHIINLSYLEEFCTELVTKLFQVFALILSEKLKLSMMRFTRFMTIESILISTLLLTHLTVAEIEYSTSIVETERFLSFLGYCTGFLAISKKGKNTLKWISNSQFQLVQSLWLASISNFLRCSLLVFAHSSEKKLYVKTSRSIECEKGIIII